MATSQKQPALRNQRLSGRGAFWIIVVCGIILGFTLFNLWFGNPMHFQEWSSKDPPADVWGTIFKGGVIVPVIHTSSFSIGYVN